MEIAGIIRELPFTFIETVLIHKVVQVLYCLAGKMHKLLPSNISEVTWTDVKIRNEITLVN